MEREENVYTENIQTETGAEAQEGAERANGGLDNVSAVLGKFKDVDALARAYSSLQAEFTRRSQKLKQLQREAEEKGTEKGAEKSSAATVGEKLRKNAAAVKAEDEKFHSFVNELETVGMQTETQDALPENLETQSARVVGEKALEEGIQQGAARAVSGKSDSSVAMSRESVDLSEGELYDKVSRNENVRLKVIGEYLASLQKAGAPLMRGGAGTLAAPPMKARSLEEAGTMALRFFKKDHAQA